MTVRKAPISNWRTYCKRVARWKEILIQLWRKTKIIVKHYTKWIDLYNISLNHWLIKCSKVPAIPLCIGSIYESEMLVEKINHKALWTQLVKSNTVESMNLYLFDGNVLCNQIVIRIRTCCCNWYVLSIE